MRAVRYLDVLCMTMLMLVGCVQNVPINPLKWSPCDSTSDTASDPTSCETVCERITQSCFSSTSLCGDREGNLTDAQALTVQACVLGCQSQIQQANPAAFSDFCDDAPAENTPADGVLCEELINTISQKCDEAESNLAASPSPTTVAPDMGGPSGGSSGVGDGGATDSMSGGASGGSDMDTGASGALSDAGGSEMGDASQADGGGTGGMSGGGCELNEGAQNFFCNTMNNCLDDDLDTPCSRSDLGMINSASARCSSGANCPAADTYVQCCSDSDRWQMDDIFVARARIIVERAKQTTEPQPQAQQCKDMNKLFSDCITSDLEALEISAVGGNQYAIAVGCAKVLQNDYTDEMSTLASLFVDGLPGLSAAESPCGRAFSANGNGGIASFNVAAWQQHCLKNCVGICGGEGFQDCPVGEACNQSEPEATLNLCVGCDDDAVSCACETRTEGTPDPPLMSCSELYLNLYDCAACGPDNGDCRTEHNCNAPETIELYEWVHPDFKGGLEACFASAGANAAAVFNPRTWAGDATNGACKNFWFSCVYCEAPYNENLHSNDDTLSGLSFAHMFCDAYDGAQNTYYQMEFNDAAACDTRRCSHDADWAEICGTD